MSEDKICEDWGEGSGLEVHDNKCLSDHNGKRPEAEIWKGNKATCPIVEIDFVFYV